MEFHQSGVPSNLPSPGAVLSESSETLSVPATGLFDFGKALGTIMRKQDCAGIQPRELGVVFKDLRVVGLGAATSYQPTLGSFFNPKPTLRDIFSGSEGIVRPGEMLRMLSLLLSESDMIFSTNLSIITLRVKRVATLPPEYVAKHYCGDIVYSPEDDIHFPKFRVDEILRFAAKMRANRLGLPRSRDVQHITDIAQTILNLCMGQVGIPAPVFGHNSNDSSTRGLDASTALEFVRTLRIATDVRTYQPSYFDRTNQARQYFIDLGFGPSHRQTISLLQLRTPSHAPRTVREDYKGPVPQTAAEFASPFLGIGNAYFKEFVGHPRVQTERSSGARDHAA
ncbi:hypothetical protein EDB92DRAFT_1942830 [Lactarius akahatsu]|uniref:Pleiotropic ABC efflux transporter N-terminal domain-containing protein n=1 Tax=Lactarius akahatsu TaxID=416441 RepID=A0AAD4LP76_9AGAM|nr:hypothetical protein EDB92DRAFT_1942830 [Lactarius akahatsu]